MPSPKIETGLERAARVGVASGFPEISSGELVGLIHSAFLISTTMTSIGLDPVFWSAWRFIPSDAGSQEAFPVSQRFKQIQIALNRGRFRLFPESRPEVLLRQLRLDEIQLAIVLVGHEGETFGTVPGEV